MVILKMVAVIAVAGVYGSMLEWFVHKTVYHRWLVKTHAKHHAEYHGARFQQPGTYHSLQRWWIVLGVLGLHALLCLGLGAGLGAVAGVAAFLVIVLFSFGSNYLHTAIHQPNHRLIERTTWYRRLVARHRAHHIDSRVNFTVSARIADLMFGTFGEDVGPGASASFARACPGER